jgi:hypothetical protein
MSPPDAPAIVAGIVRRGVDVLIRQAGENELGERSVWLRRVHEDGAVRLYGPL